MSMVTRQRARQQEIDARQENDNNKRRRDNADEDVQNDDNENNAAEGNSPTGATDGRQKMPQHQNPALFVLTSAQMAELAKMLKGGTKKEENDLSDSHFVKELCRRFDIKLETSFPSGSDIRWEDASTALSIIPILIKLECNINIRHYDFYINSSGIKGDVAKTLQEVWENEGVSGPDRLKAHLKLRMIINAYFSLMQCEYPTDSLEFAREWMDMNFPLLEEFENIMRPYVNAKIERARGKKAAAIAENTIKLKKSDLPATYHVAVDVLNSSKFATEGTHTSGGGESSGFGGGSTRRCRYCRKTVTSFDKHNPKCSVLLKKRAKKENSKDDDN